MLLSSVPTELIVYFCQIQIITFYQSVNSNKSNVIDVALTVYLFFDPIIKKVPHYKIGKILKKTINLVRNPNL